MKSICLWFVCFCLMALGNARAVESAQGPVEVQIHSVQTNLSLVAVPEPSAKAIRHYHSGLELLGISTVGNLALLAILLFTGFSARMRSWAERWGRNWYGSFVLYFVAFGLIYFLASLPLSYYAGFIRPHSYDLSNQTLGRWWGNHLKGQAVTLVLGLAVGWIPFLVIQRSPRRWWLYLALLAMPLMCAQLLLEPVLIDPLFHHYQPLQDKTLETKILAEAARAGITGSRVYEVNMSADTKTLNAYVTGFGGTKRIVLWDTLLKQLNPDEVQFVLGHEMGHYVLGHMVKIMAFQSALILLCLYCGYRLSGPVLRRFQHRWGFSTLSDFAALPLGLLGFWCFLLAVLPLWMAFSRHIEHEADRFGLELTQDNHAAATAFVKLQQSGLGISRPGPLAKIWLFDHPPIGERIDFCNHYRPWETGQPSRYEAFIKP